MEINPEIQEHFTNMNVEIGIYPEETKRSFRSLNSFFEYYQKERDFWNECTEGVTREIRAHFHNIYNNLNNALQNFESNPNQAIRNLNESVDLAKLYKFPCVYSTTIFGKFIKERYSQSPGQAEAACHFFFKEISLGVNKEYFKGLIYSFLMTNHDIAATVESESQRLALSDLRDRFAREIEVLHNEYLFKKEEVNKSNYSFQESISKWSNEITTNVKVFLEESTLKMTDLEKLYAEKLRLESPATYWKRLSEDYNQKGEKWKNWAIGSIVVFIIYLTAILYNLPQTWLESAGLNISSIKSTIIFALITSMGIYLISLFIKLSTSAYHLSRDANERFQLTHVYLSLLHEKGVTDADRNIVLQSIFSRADTGLLKGDSSPALPDGFLSQLFKNINSK